MQTPPNQDTVENLAGLSTHLQAAGLHELGLLVRQLAVANREKSYSEDDQQFIKASLQALMPQAKLDAVYQAIGEKNAKLKLNNF